MYYKLTEYDKEQLKEIQKVIPVKYVTDSEFIWSGDILNMLKDLYFQYMKFVDYVDNNKI